MGCQYEDQEFLDLMSNTKLDEFVVNNTADNSPRFVVLKNPVHKIFAETSYRGPVLIVNTFDSQENLIGKLRTYGKINYLYHFGSSSDSTKLSEIYSYIQNIFKSDSFPTDKSSQPDLNTPATIDPPKKHLQPKNQTNPLTNNQDCTLIQPQDIALKIRPKRFVMDGLDGSLSNSSAKADMNDLRGWNGFARFTERKVVQIREYRLVGRKLTPPFDGFKFQSYNYIKMFSR